MLDVEPDGLFKCARIIRRTKQGAHLQLIDHTSRFPKKYFSMRRKQFKKVIFGRSYCAVFAGAM